MVDNRDSTGAERSGRETTRERDFSRRTVLKTTGTAVGGLAMGGFAGAAAANGEAPPRLHTDGKWIENADGEEVTLRGISTADPAYYDKQHPKSPGEVVDWAADPSRGWYPDVVRLPVGKWGIDQYGVETLVQDLVRPLVDALADRGVYALVDFHLVHPYTEAAAADSDATDYSPDELVRTFWGEAAPEFADDDHVIFELFNEPTYPVSWGEFGEDVGSEEEEWLLWRDTAQPWVDMVRDAAPDTPLIIGSPEWTSRTNLAPEYPFDGDNLVYASHIYPDNGSPAEFDERYGTPAEEVPVVVTEFGWDPESGDLDGGTNSGWGEPFLDWVASYENMGAIGWCFDDTWAPTLFDSPGDGMNEPWTLRNGPEEPGGFLKEWLAEHSDDPVAKVRASAQRATVGHRLAFEAADASGESNWIDSLAWDFGDGTTAEGWSTAHRYEEPGDYQVGLTATDDAGTSTTYEVTVTVDELTEKLAKAVPGTTAAAVGETVAFEVDDTSGADRWITGLEWEFGDGTTAEGWWTDHAYDEAGTYTVELTATDDTGHSTTHAVEMSVE